MIQGSLLYLWIHKSLKQQLNLQLLSTEKLTSVDESTTKLTGMLNPGVHPLAGNPEVTGIPQVDYSTS